MALLRLLVELCKRRTHTEGQMEFSDAQLITDLSNLIFVAKQESMLFYSQGSQVLPYSKQVDHVIHPVYI